MRSTILVTGGTGYIGSHTCIEMIAAGHDVVVIDDLSNSKPETIQRIKEISGRSIDFLPLDIRDRAGLRALFKKYQFDAVIHFAGLKAVAESVEKPRLYYDVNVSGSLVLFDSMAEANVTKLVFSSSATVYGVPRSVPIREDFLLCPTNPYGRSKLIVEDILRDIHRTDKRWRIAVLRYFNPVGAHVSGKLGEDPNGIPNNLMPILSQVACGKRDSVAVYGDDYSTRDGTGVRDYIHVCDLALGHVKAMEALWEGKGVLTVNLGTGIGYSVLEVIRAFEAASGRKVKYNITARRAGDVAECFADPTMAKQLLDWSADRGLEQMCADAWRWQQRSIAG